MVRGGYIYITTNKANTVLYTGVTNNLKVRIYKHKSHVYPGSFTSKYNVTKLVYFESFQTIVEAISREKQLKAGSRNKKIELINVFNPDWNDLYDLIPED